MNPQQTAELNYWRGVFASQPPAQYLLARHRDLRSEATWLPRIWGERGPGLDLACGLVSVLEYLPEAVTITAADALMDHYDQIYRPTPRAGLHYECQDGEGLPADWTESFDFVWCMNAIDHTPDPGRMLSEIRRVLRPGGRLYFFVNFDPEVYAPHYGLWDMAVVERALAGFHLIHGTRHWAPEWKRYEYSGMYEKVV